MLSFKNMSHLLCQAWPIEKEGAGRVETLRDLYLIDERVWAVFAPHTVVLQEQSPGRTAVRARMTIFHEIHIKNRCDNDVDRCGYSGFKPRASQQVPKANGCRICVPR